MTDQEEIPQEGGPNLLVLKGVVWGLGLLLVLGTIILGLKMASFGSEEDEPTTTSASLSSVVMAEGYPPLPLHPGESIGEMQAGGGIILVSILKEGEVHRILTIHVSGGTRWVPIEVISASP